MTRPAIVASIGAAVLTLAVFAVGGAWPAVTLAAALMAAGVAWHVGDRRRTRQLIEVSAALERVTAGDFTARIDLSGPQPLRALARAVNRVGESCARRDDDLNDALEDAARQRDLFYSIINASSDGLLLYDADGQLVATNPRCGELLGFTVNELLHRDPSWLRLSLQARSEDPDEYVERLDDHFAHADAPHQDVLVIRAPRRRVIRRASSPVTLHRGGLGRVFTYTDVTAEAEIDQMKSEFVSMTSHELRTPLTSVHGALQLALSGSGARMEAEDRELLEICLTNTERLVRLVNDLLDLSKIEAGRMPLTPQPLDVRALVGDAIRGLQGLAAARQARIDTSISPDLPPLVADRDQILRVLTNLLSNALKYSPPEAQIGVAATLSQEGMSLSVADDGPGIPEAHLDRLFRPFSRVGVHERQTVGGTGLGLAITRALVEQHGGRIFVEPVVPTGCRFVVVLPTETVARTGTTQP